MINNARNVNRMNLMKFLKLRQKLFDVAIDYLEK